MNEQDKLSFRQNQPNVATIEMTVTPYMEQLLKENLNLEIEMLQGKREVLADGRLRCQFTVTDQQKIMMCRQFVLMINFQNQYTSIVRLLQFLGNGN